MQSPLSERSPIATYRIIKMPLFETPDSILYAVYGYDIPGDVDGWGPHLYRFDLLPQWMQDAIAALDVAGQNHKVEGIGRKIGETYWINPTVDVGTGV